MLRNIIEESTPNIDAKFGYFDKFGFKIALSNNYFITSKFGEIFKADKTINFVGQSSREFERDISKYVYSDFEFNCSATRIYAG